MERCVRAELSPILFMQAFQKKLYRKRKQSDFEPIHGLSIRGGFYRFCNPRMFTSPLQYTNMEVKPLTDEAKVVCQKYLHQYYDGFDKYNYVPIEHIQTVVDELEGNYATISETT